MLILEYNPENGWVVPDGRAEATILEWYESSKLKESKYVVGTEAIIHAARVLIKRGTIPIEDIEFRFQGKKVNCNENGVIEDWPIGFCDIILGFTIEILTRNQSKK